MSSEIKCYGCKYFYMEIYNRSFTIFCTHPYPNKEKIKNYLDHQSVTIDYSSRICIFLKNGVDYFERYWQLNTNVCQNKVEYIDDGNRFCDDYEDPQVIYSKEFLEWKFRKFVKDKHPDAIVEYAKWIFSPQV